MAYILLVHAPRRPNILENRSICTDPIFNEDFWMLCLVLWLETEQLANNIWGIHEISQAN
jgi:hypothetical protein